MNLDVRIDHHKCVATGCCAASAPEHFCVGPDGKALARGEGGPPVTDAKLTDLTVDASNLVREVAMFCPAEAIEVGDHDSGEQYYP